VDRLERGCRALAQVVTHIDGRPLIGRTAPTAAANLSVPLDALDAQRTSSSTDVGARGTRPGQVGQLEADTGDA
jgi:hypothetical protein